MQDLAQAVVVKQVAALKSKHDLNNAALVAMRPDSGEVVAMVGSAGFSDVAISGQVNVARSPRQPGSALKPVSTRRRSTQISSARPPCCGTCR